MFGFAAHVRRAGLADAPRRWRVAHRWWPASLVLNAYADVVQLVSPNEFFLFNGLVCLIIPGAVLEVCADVAASFGGSPTARSASPAACHD